MMYPNLITVGYSSIVIVWTTPQQMCIPKKATNAKMTVKVALLFSSEDKNQMHFYFIFYLYIYVLINLI